MMRTRRTRMLCPEQRSPVARVASKGIEFRGASGKARGRRGLGREAMGAAAAPKIMPETRRFPPPWTFEDHNHACFIVKDANGLAVAYVYYEEEPGRRTACRPPKARSARFRPPHAIRTSE